MRPHQTVATPDHNVPTINQDKPIEDKLSRFQVDTLGNNCKKHGIDLYGLNTEYQGIVHVMGPQLGVTQPGMTIVCGDSHTSTHGAFGCIAFGIGTSEVEMVLATQCILQPKPKKMRINVNGQLKPNVSPKDVILYIISKLTAAGGTGYFVEYAGNVFREMSMQGRMTVCNMSIEMGARGGLIAPDLKTFEFVKGKKYAPKGADYEKALSKWTQLYTDEDAVFDHELHFDASDIEPMITFGTNPGMGVKITGKIPELSSIDSKEQPSFQKSMAYMGFQAGDTMIGKPVDYVFIGSCTNGRIEDLRIVADFVKGKQKAANVTAWIVPGSKEVERQAIKEGIVETLEAAGFKMRQPGLFCLFGNE